MCVLRPRAYCCGKRKDIDIWKYKEKNADSEEGGNRGTFIHQPLAGKTYKERNDGTAYTALHRTQHTIHGTTHREKQAPDDGKTPACLLPACHVLGLVASTPAASPNCTEKNNQPGLSFN